MNGVNDIDDRWPRRIGILGFGLIIPLITGLMRDVSPFEPRYWVGLVWFVLLAAAIWHGNRWLLFRQREHFDWFTRPVGKVASLVIGCVFFTVPITAAAIVAWVRAAGLGPVDLEVLARVELVNVISVLFVTHIYETAFLVKGRRSDRSAIERLDQLRAEAELAALRGQIDPHFLFNALNTLNWLIEREPARATEYTDRLAQVYRYILANRNRDLVPLRDELAFVDAYFHLHAVRFGASLEMVRPNAADPWLDGKQVPPISLQPLLENAIKHNEFSERDPLRVELQIFPEHIEVRNRVRRRASPGRQVAAGEAVDGTGLANLGERVLALTGRSICVRAGPQVFAVEVPLSEVSA